MRSLLIAAAAVAAAAGLFVVLRPADADEPAATPPATTVTETRVTVDVSKSPPPPPRRLGPARVRIEVREARPVGGVRRITVARGRRVILTVTSDVADHVHLHGYDVMRNVAPGQPARIAFRATIVGTVEAELEDRRVPIATVTTKP